MSLKSLCFCIFLKWRFSLMGETVDQPPSDPSDVVGRAVEILNAGQVVCLSDGRRSAIIANGACDRREDDWERHSSAEARNGSGGVLLLRDATSALDFIAEPSPVVRRIMRRCWPGDVRLVLAGGMDEELTGQLPRAVRQTVENERGFALCVPVAATLRQVLQRVAFPLVKISTNHDAAQNQPSGITVLHSESASVTTGAEIQIAGDRWELLSGSGLSPEEATRMTTERILFVCTGNTCRSPMAAGMFRHMLAERLGCRESELSQQGFEIASAGLSAGPGCPASPESVEICRVCGVDLSGHSSQPLTQPLLFDSDRIYTMTAGHRDAILSRYPELENDVRLLSPAGEDVTDPIGWGSAAYQQCHREITESLKPLVDELAANH